MLVLLGSRSDVPRAKGALDTLEALDVPFEVTLVSAHRDPARLDRRIAEAERDGVQVIIAGAGLAAHLAGAAASRTLIPVVGVPLSGGPLDGVDALLSTVQMPPGVPVATVGIDQAQNAALAAAQILALSDSSLRDRLRSRRLARAEALEADDGRLQSEGPKAFLS